MTFRLKLFRTAVREVDHILNWLHCERQSPAGARAWQLAYERAIQKLRTSPEQQPLAPENNSTDFEVRHLLFKTRHGRPYRLIFTIVGHEVRVLHVRRPGQDLVPPERLVANEGT